ncbi:MAG: polyprenol monophosphomannose synthase [Candidatus Magasanikbacteria bacterium]
MIAIIIPTYNERENIATLLEKIFSLSIFGLEIIVVDDNSPDGTADIVKQLQNKYPLHLIERGGKLGLGSAYIVGFKKALELGADYIFEMDADWSHDPADIPRLLSACQNGADLAIGSRKVPGGGVVGWNWWRKFESNGAMWFSRLVLKLKPHDVTAGFRCFNSQVLKNIPLDSIRSNGYAFQEELLYYTQKLNFKITEIPVLFKDRASGLSKLSHKDIAEFFIVIIKLKFS